MMVLGGCLTIARDFAKLYGGEFQDQPVGLARLYGRLAFANAALGNRAEACRWAGRTIRLRPRERRAYLALAVSSGLVSAGSLVEAAHKRGKGI